MTIERDATKMRKTNNRQSRNQGVDRLSSLPDDILIEIISLLPLNLAISTGTISHRWRGLWTKTTSIDITFRDYENLCKIDTGLNETVMQITSPCIYSFRLEYAGDFSRSHFRVPSIDTIIRKICDRNVHQLKITWPHKRCRHRRYILPDVVFKMQSLVSVELGSTYCSRWHFPNSCSAINLPYLKKLSLHFSWQLQWIEKLTKACPSLEELSLDYTSSGICESLRSLKCSNQKLRQLIINIPLFRSSAIVIDAPNLEYFVISAPKCMTISFAEEPIVLRETKIEFTDDLHQAQTDKDKFSKLYGAISNVRFLTLDISAIDTLPIYTVFRNVTLLTFNMKWSHTLDTLLSVLQRCPVVDVLALKFWCVHNDEEQPLYRKLGNVSTLQRTLERIKSINVEIDNRKAYCKPSKSFLRLIAELLRIGRNLEHFNLRVNDCQDCQLDAVMLNQEHELKLCKVLYRCSMASACCDVEFNGRFLKMSRKNGPKAWTKKGGVIRFHRSWKGFTTRKNNARYLSRSYYRFISMKLRKST